MMKIKHYTFSDSIYFDKHGLGDKSNLKSYLGLTTNSSVELCIIRLLMGGVSVSNNVSGDSFETENNYFLNPVDTRSSRSIISDYKRVFDFSLLGCEDIVECLNMNRTNSSFFINILFELSHALNDAKKGSHVQSFLHIYRAYEHISYSFPLIYLSTEVSYANTYKSLKDYFSDGGDSELKFCKQFIGKILPESILASTLDVTFTNNKSENEKVLKRLSVGNSFEFNSFSVKIEFQYVWDLVVELRNKYFHHLSGMSNSISSQQLACPNSFFKEINTLALQLFAVIYLNIVQSRIKG
ncbi:hypothetical protein RB978_004279 [Vibrio vulnificus]|nr:hypothetical protein [Vibrio vulnificus]